MQTHPLGLGSPEALGDDRASSPRKGGKEGGPEDQEGAVHCPAWCAFPLWAHRLNPNIPVGLNKDFLQVQPGQEYPALAQEKPRAQVVETGHIEIVGKLGGGEGEAVF